MARLLNKLAQQPEPLLKRMNLDAQPERPLLQRLLSRLPQRRPGERYAFRFEPLGFLARHPQSPLLAGVSLWKQPKVSNTTWVNKAPLESLAASDSSLLGKMDSHRVPGIITAILLLGLSLNYLLSLPADVEKAPEEVAETSEPAATDDIADAADAAETVEAPAATALTPEEEKDVTAKEAVAVATSANLMSVAKEDKAASASPEPEVVKAAATAAPVAKTEEDPAEAPAAKEDTPAPIVASKPAAEPVADPAPKAKAPAATPAPTAAKAPAASPPVASKPAPEPKAAEAAKPEPAATKAEAPKEMTAAEPASQAGKTKSASTATAESSSETPVIAAEADTGVDAKKPEESSKSAEQNATDETAPVQAAAVAPATRNPRTLSVERSNNILNSAKYIYLLGDGPLALERLGMALNAGHVHEDLIEPFRKLDAEIRRLLVLFEQAKSTENPKLAGQSRAAFMDTEEKTFPGEFSAYAAHLENLAAEELLPPQPVEKKKYGPR